MTRAELAALRAEVRRRRNAVTAKQARIKRELGIDVRAAGYDPRRDSKVIAKYTAKQLTSYLNDLDSFMSRKNNFVAGSGGSVIPRSDWQQYKKLENKYNNIGSKHFDAVSGIFIPTSGLTIRQRDATIRPDSIHAQGEIVNRPYSQTNRKPVNVKDAKALKKLISEMRKKVSPEYLKKQIKEGREQLNHMLTVIGNGDLVKRAENLTDSQFDVLWNYTNFATNVSGIYAIMQKQTAESSDRWYASVIEDYSSDIGELFSWAEQLSTDGTNAAAKKSSRTAPAQKKNTNKRR